MTPSHVGCFFMPLTQFALNLVWFKRLPVLCDKRPWNQTLSLPLRLFLMIWDLPLNIFTQKRLCWLSRMAFFVFVVSIRLPPQAEILPSFPLKKSKIPLLVKISTIKWKMNRIKTCDLFSWFPNSVSSNSLDCKVKCYEMITEYCSV